MEGDRGTTPRAFEGTTFLENDRKGEREREGKKREERVTKRLSRDDFFVLSFLPFFTHTRERGISTLHTDKHTCGIVS